MLPIEILMKETDPALVSYEMDIYWAVNGGADPLALLARVSGAVQDVARQGLDGPAGSARWPTSAGHDRLQDDLRAARRASSTTSSSTTTAPIRLRRAAASYKYLSKLEY